MFDRFSLPKYFSFHLRREVLELYGSAAIGDIALSAMMLFEPAYLYAQLGLSVPKIMLFFAVVYFWYTLLIPLGGKITSRVGLKHALIASVPFQLLYWVALYFAQYHGWLVWVAPVFFAIQKSLYWPGYHSILAKYARHGQVGREFSMLAAITQAVQIFGPLLGGLIAQAKGGDVLLLVASGIYAMSALPLILHKDTIAFKKYLFSSTLNLYKTQRKQFFGYLGFGEELLAFTVWPLFIFLVAKGYEGTGAILTFSAGLSVVLSLYLGKLTDGHPKRPLLKLGSVLTAGAWFFRSFMGSFGGITVANTTARVAKNIYFIPLSALTYERAEAREILPYVVFFEQSLSIGKMLTALVAALLFALLPSFPLLFVLAALLSFLFLLV